MIRLQLKRALSRNEGNDTSGTCKISDGNGWPFKASCSIEGWGAWGGVEWVSGGWVELDTAIGPAYCKRSL